MYSQMYDHDDLVNLSEEIVFEALHTIIEERSVEFCQCGICVQDITAITLNRIPVKYVTSIIEVRDPRDSLRQELGQIRKQAKDEILKAIERVKHNAHH